MRRLFRWGLWHVRRLRLPPLPIINFILILSTGVLLSQVLTQSNDADRKLAGAVQQLRENQRRIAELRERRIKDQTAAFVFICRENQNQDKVLTGLIRAADSDDDGDPPNPRFQAEAKKALVTLKPNDCRKLPALGPFRK